MQLFAHSKKHASSLHTVLQPQVQKTVLRVTKFLKKIRVSECQQISERTVEAALRGRPPLSTRLHELDDIGFSNTISTEGGHGGLPLQFVPRCAIT